MFGIPNRKLRLAVAFACAISVCSLVNLYVFHIVPFINTLTILWPKPVVPVAFPYRNASWKPEIGRWLSDCDSQVKSVQIVETIQGRSCKDECSGQGNCNFEFGECRCFNGYAGENCSEIVKFECNHPSTSEKEPYGRWGYSICPAHCDTTRALCFCGEGTKYPKRAVPEGCGFKMNPPLKPGGLPVPDWSVRDENIFTTNASLKGWCNVDPQDAYDSKVKFKEQCDCGKYDGWWGRFCEIPTQMVCINQCSRHGYCRGGSCQCENDWYGVDCSVPSISSYMKEWPTWLVPFEINSTSHNSVAYDFIAEKKRPLIYVYDLPHRYTTLLLEGRNYKQHCVSRVYDARNATQFTSQPYGSQIAIYESMLASPHRTLNAEEADYFFVPVFDSWIIPQYGEVPHHARKEHQRRSENTFYFYKDAYDHIMMQYPYWNRSAGKDHIWMFAWDEGACMAPKEIWNGIMLVHWGNTNTKHINSTTAYDDDNWDFIPKDLRGNHTCFDPIKDIIIPAWKIPYDISFGINHLQTRALDERDIFFYFNGNLGPPYNGRPEESYSMGIRQRIGEEFGSIPNKDGKLGKQRQEDVIVLSKRSDSYKEELANSVFCGVFPGDGWSPRMEDSILHGCIPVIIQDGIYLPYENVFNLESFGVRISEDDIPNMIRILRNISESEIERKQTNLVRIFQRFLYRDSIMLEAERQKRNFGLVEDWAVQFSQLEEDDLFATLIQILHYKLHNDEWRKEFESPKRKDYGVPPQCVGVRWSQKGINKFAF